MQKFILLTRQRSGSTVLIRSLDRHEQIFCAGEIFHSTNDIYRPEQWFKNDFQCRYGRRINRVINIAMARNAVRRHILEFYSRAERDNYKAAGFKLMVSQMYLYPELNNWIERPDVRKVILIRENLLDIAVSKMRAVVTGTSHQSANGRLSERKITVDPTLLVREMQTARQDNNKLKDHPKKENMLVVRYEELYDWQEAANTIFDFLCVDRVEIAPVLEKRSSHRHEENILNYDEVVGVLERTGFDRYLSKP